MPNKSAEQGPLDKVVLSSYLANLVAIVNYLDDTGQEYHVQRFIAEEWR